jgi:hypothetical protein
VPKWVLIMVTCRVVHGILQVHPVRVPVMMAMKVLVTVGRLLLLLLLPLLLRLFISSATSTGHHTSFAPAASPGQVAPLARLLVELGGDDDACSRGLAAARELTPPGVPSLLDAAKGENTRGGWRLAGAAEVPGPPASPGPATSTKYERQGAVDPGEDVPTVSPTGRRCITGAACTCGGFLLGGEGLPSRPSIADGAPPFALRVFPIVLFVAPCLALVASGPPPAQALSLAGWEHGKCGAQRPGDEGHAPHEELEIFLLFLGGLRVERDGLTSQRICSRVALDIPVGLIVKPISMGAVGLDPADAAIAASTFAASISVQNDARVPLAGCEGDGRRRLSGHDDVVTIRPQVAGSGCHAPSDADPHMFACLRSLG